jgi:hypothetical protein
VTEIHDVAPGLWTWRLEHPDYHGDAEWDGRVACTCVESRGEVAVLDPLEPPEGDEAWERLDARPPTMVVILKPDHVRHVDAFTRRYGITGYGPLLYWRHDVPEVELEPIRRGSELPGGLRCLWDGRGQLETPLWLPEQRAIVFADGMTAPDGELRVWNAAEHERWALPAFQAMLELPFEHVIVSHGAPVHDRAAFERALDRPPWGLSWPDDD